TPVWAVSLHDALPIALHLGGFAGYADQYAGAGGEEAVLVHLADEVLEHFFRDLEVGDDAVFQWADSGDIAWCTSQHALGVTANRSEEHTSELQSRENL